MDTGLAFASRGQFAWAWLCQKVNILSAQMESLAKAQDIQQRILLNMETHLLSKYVLLLLGLVILLINHLSVLNGNLWLIPTFLRIP